MTAEVLKSYANMLLSMLAVEQRSSFLVRQHKMRCPTAFVGRSRCKQTGKRAVGNGLDCPPQISHPCKWTSHNISD